MGDLLRKKLPIALQRDINLWDFVGIGIIIINREATIHVQFLLQHDNMIQHDTTTLW